MSTSTAHGRSRAGRTSSSSLMSQVACRKNIKDNTRNQTTRVPRGAELSNYTDNTCSVFSLRVNHQVSGHADLQMGVMADWIPELHKPPFVTPSPPSRTVETRTHVFQCLLREGSQTTQNDSEAEETQLTLKHCFSPKKERIVTPQRPEVAERCASTQRPTLVLYLWLVEVMPFDFFDDVKRIHLLSLPCTVVRRATNKV